MTAFCWHYFKPKLSVHGIILGYFKVSFKVSLGSTVPFGKAPDRM